MLIFRPLLMRRAISDDFPLRIVKNNDSYAVKIGDRDYVNKAPLREGIRPGLPGAAQRKFHALEARRETFLSQRVIVAMKVKASLRLPARRAPNASGKFMPRTLSVN
ncbi:MAG TPA: hypothetical protein VF658_00440 [Pyrinomonadaceae bacterium]|jgi:hypothetical protein